MAYFAELEFGIVTQVIVVGNSDCANGILPDADIVGGAFITNLGLAGLWKFSEETDGKQRYNSACIGFTYDTARDAFIAPKPYPSWALDENVMGWFAPVPMPSEGGPWVWDEATLSWFLTP